jgi:hypothetical protein
VWCTAGQLSRPSTFFTDDMPLELNNAWVSMYADDSTIYASATTANEVTETLNLLKLWGTIYMFGKITFPK